MDLYFTQISKDIKVQLMYTSQSSSLEQEEHPNELKLLNKYIYNDYILQGLFKHKKKNERDEVAQC